VAASGTDAAAIEELRGALEELGRRRQGDEETVVRLEELAASVAELTARPAADPALASQVGQLAEALGELAEDTTVADLRIVVDSLASRSDAGDQAVAEIAERIEELGAGVTALQAEDVAGRLRADVDEIRLRLETDDASLAELRAAAAELAARPAGDPELAARLAALAGRVDEIASDTAAAAAHDGRALEQLLLASAATRDELVAQLEAVSVRIAALESAPPPPVDAAVGPDDLIALREEMAEELRQGLAHLSAETPADDTAWVVEADRLAERLDALAALVGEGTSEPAADAKMRSRRAPAPVEPESDTERELERLRMAIERMSLHLGEQERALAEVMRSRGVAQRLDELEARIDDVAAGAVPAGAAPGGAVPAGSSADVRALTRRLDGAEAALDAEREKMLTKLERMASSIDWRLQRLEAGKPDS
jgi:hypothetical protein